MPPKTTKADAAVAPTGRDTPTTVSFEGRQRHVGVPADGRMMAAPKHTLRHLPLTLGNAATLKRRAERSLWLFNIQDSEGTPMLGPANFNEECAVSPAGALSMLVKRCISYALDKETVSELCVAVHDYLSDSEVSSLRDAFAIADIQNSSFIRHSDVWVVHGIVGRGRPSQWLARRFGASELPKIAADFGPEVKFDMSSFMSGPAGSLLCFDVSPPCLGEQTASCVMGIAQKKCVDRMKEDQNDIFSINDQASLSLELGMIRRLDRVEASLRLLVGNLGRYSVPG